MESFAHADIECVHRDLKERFVGAGRAATSVEIVAQRCADIIYSEFQSAVLVRVYLTSPFSGLPPINRLFVERLISEKGRDEKLTESTIVLSLLATRGRKPAWNDRKKSKGHMGIPLVSARFVQSVPMIFRLLVEFGIGTDWINQESGCDIIAKSMGKMGAAFYVPDARTFRDNANRLVIPAQDFVNAEGVKTVFGVGGAYADGNICTFLCFTSESLKRRTIERFSPVINYFKAATIRLINTGKLFEPD